MFKKILVPLDQSELAERSIRQAMTIARGSDAEVDLVLVHEPVALDGYFNLPRDDSDQDETGYLRTTAEEVCSGSNTRVTHTVLRGAPADMIVRHAKETGADLIVMTSHGRTGFNRMWFGSVTDAVIRRANCPVLVLHPKHIQTSGRPARRRFGNIVVPTDRSALAWEAVRPAASLARATGGWLTLLQIVQPVPHSVPIKPFAPEAHLVNVPDEDATNQLVALCSAKLKETARRLSEAEELPVASAVWVSDHVAKGIVDYAAGHGVDAIAMSTRGRGMSRYLLGSVAEQVLRSSEIPVLIQRPVVAEDVVTITSAEVTEQLPAMSGLQCRS